MSQKYTVDDLLQVVEHGVKPPPCDDTMQIRVFFAENGVAKGSWKVDERYLNGHGVVMGGFISAAADIMMAYAMASVLAKRQEFASIDLDTTFHRPTFVGEVEIMATVERLGRSIAYVVTQLIQKDKKVATCVSSVMVHAVKS